MVLSTRHGNLQKVRGEVLSFRVSTWTRPRRTDDSFSLSCEVTDSRLILVLQCVVVALMIVVVLNPGWELPIHAVSYHIIPEAGADGYGPTPAHRGRDVRSEASVIINTAKSNV